MSKRSVRHLRIRSEDRSQPTILKRRKTTDPSSEVKSDASSSSESDFSRTLVTPLDNSVAFQTEPNDGKTTPSDLVSAVTFSQFRGLASLTYSCARESPLPQLTWADPRDVWDSMVRKDAVYPRDHKMLSHHPTLHAKMRAILLDWLIEVCEVYRLHRETFYLAQDFIDRYLALKCSVPKQQLQLLGITALFIAAKIEEIYPPKLAEFAYVTDGACTENEILDKELVLLKALNWDLTPMTINGWLNIYLQLADNMEKDGDGFLVPDFSGHVYVQVAQLLDLCILDVGCLEFPYSIVAASGLYHMTSEKVALTVSGWKWIDIVPCVRWMTPFAQVVRENGGAELKFLQQIAVDDMHNIQTHSVDLQLLEKAQSKQGKLSSVLKSSPNKTGILTPPQSSEKLPCSSISS